MAEGLPKQKLELVASTFLFQNMDEIVVERIVSDARCLREQGFSMRPIFADVLVWFWRGKSKWTN